MSKLVFKYEYEKGMKLMNTFKIHSLWKAFV